MKAQNQILILLLILLIGLILIGFNAVDITRGLAAIKSQTYMVSGKVVDENGGELSGVLVVISDHTPIEMGTKTIQRERTQTVNGFFRVESNGYQILSLYFTKTGYHNVVLNYSKGGKYSNTEVTLCKEP